MIHKLHIDYNGAPFVIEIDAEKLTPFMRKAVTSTGGRCREASGALVVKPAPEARRMIRIQYNFTISEPITEAHACGMRQVQLGGATVTLAEGPDAALALMSPEVQARWNAAPHKSYSRAWVG